MMKLTLVFLPSVFLLQTATAQQVADRCESLGRAGKPSRLITTTVRFEDCAWARIGVKSQSEIAKTWDLSVFFKGKPYVNRGTSGQTTPQILLRFRQDVIALKPDIVVILAGANDLAENTGPTSLEAIEDNLKSMVDLARKNGVRPILASVLPAAAYPWRPEIRPIDKILALNQWMKEYAETEGIGYLDYYSAMVTDQHGLKPELSGDGVHPNEAGYAIMASLVADAIAKSKLQAAKKLP